MDRERKLMNGEMSHKMMSSSKKKKMEYDFDIELLKMYQ